MKLCDVDLLIYAVEETSHHHDRARRWLEARLSGTETFGLAWLVLMAFLRLSTQPRVFESPLEVREAFDCIDGWLSQPCATVVAPTDRHGEVLRELLLPLGTAGNLTNDARLAAPAIEHSAEPCSADTGSSHFPGLRWSDPLAGDGR
ncbi:MAG: Ribonuclease VapC37 [Acidimicrobiales bacterium]|nr:Ribonuclease VapC37 [Acidimicrobiales bacterium]